MIPSIWTSMFHQHPLIESLLILNGCGWTAFEISIEHLKEIETSDTPDVIIADALRYADDLGLSFPQSHPHLRANVASFDDEERRADIDRIVRHMDISAKLGVKIVTIHPGRFFGEPAEEDAARVRELNVEGFREIRQRAEELDLAIGLENLGKHNPSTAAEMLDLIDAIDRPGIGVTFDTSHANIAGLDMPAAIRELGDRLTAVHISDNHGESDEHLIPGDGRIDWPPIMEALRDVGFEGTLNLEIPGVCHLGTSFRKLKARHAREVADHLIAMIA
jgi:sugar phosphate isomerase/epimerase